MSFINWIIERFNDLSSAFYSMYLDAYYAGFPLNLFCDPLYWLSDLCADIAWAFYDFGLWVNDVWYRVQQILDFETIWNYFKAWFEWAEWAWAWVVNAWANVLDIITTWWSETWLTVEAWFEARIADVTTIISQVESWVVSLQSEWNSFKSKIPSIDDVILWVSNWWNNILPNLTSWWYDRLNEVQGLIDSVKAELLPMIEGWSEIRESAVEFFSDPLQWLYDRLDEFFERFW